MRTLVAVLALVLCTPALAAEEVLGGKNERIRLEGRNGPEVAIPKNWRFVGVSTGSKPNANNLWFEAPDGTIYLVQGFVEGSYFYVRSSYTQSIHRR